MTESCTRCGDPVPEMKNLEPDGFWWVIRMTQETEIKRNVLRMTRFKLNWDAESSGDRIRSFYTTLQLCSPCTGDVFMFAQGKEVDDGRS